MERFAKKIERNPYGETFEEFVGKYPEIKHIAEACWFFGVRPEEFAEELRTLLDGITEGDVSGH